MTFVDGTKLTALQLNALQLNADQIRPKTIFNLVNDITLETGDFVSHTGKISSGGTESIVETYSEPSWNNAQITNTAGGVIAVQNVRFRIAGSDNNEIQINLGGASSVNDKTLRENVAYKITITSTGRPTIELDLAKEQEFIEKGSNVIVYTVHESSTNGVKIQSYINADAGTNGVVKLTKHSKLNFDLVKGKADTFTNCNVIGWVEQDYTDADEIEVTLIGGTYPYVDSFPKFHMAYLQDDGTLGANYSGTIPIRIGQHVGSFVQTKYYPDPVYYTNEHDKYLYNVPLSCSKTKWAYKLNYSSSDPVIIPTNNPHGLSYFNNSFTGEYVIRDSVSISTFSENWTPRAKVLIIRSSQQTDVVGQLIRGID